MKEQAGTIVHEATEHANPGLSSARPVPLMVNTIPFYSFLKDKYYRQQDFGVSNSTTHHYLGMQTPSAKRQPSVADLRI